MRCETAQRSLSEAMDGAASVSPEVDAHRRSCATCMRFEQGAWGLRSLVRFDEGAVPAPELVPSVMEKVLDYEADRMLGWVPEPHPLRRRLYRQRFVLAALASGLIIGIVITSGGFLPISNEARTAGAEEIPPLLVRAAKNVDGYRATFDVTELHWAKAVPRRSYVATLAYRAPESFRVQVRDTTRYPSAVWPRNDLRLVTDGHTWQASGPDPCPAAALPACPGSARVIRSVVNRVAFDSRSSMPTDVIVPMTVLAASRSVEVIGPDRVAGRDAVALDLTYQEGAPLFDSLQFLGSWRPFFPQDRVVLWLDRETMFPLEYKVFPAGGPARASWASQTGLPDESAQTPVFTAVARSFAETRPPPGLFRIGREPNALDEGFHDSAFPEPRGAPYPPGDAELMPPRVRDGLRPWRYGRFARTDVRPYRQTVMSYSKGLSWLTVTRVIGWTQPALFGVGPFAEALALGGGEIGYYEPATDTDPRRIALHTIDGEFLVSTNLPRAALIRIARSLAVTGLPVPDAWRVHRWPGGTVIDGLSLEQAVGRTRFPVLLPGYLPTGYRLAAAETIRTEIARGITVVFRRPAAELDGFGLHLYQARGQSLPPPTGADQQMVMVGGRAGRWSPQDHLLEWMDGAIYRSLQGPAFDLGTLVHVAESLRRAARPPTRPGASP